MSNVVKEHPEWLILDKNGKHGRMIRDLAALCPAVPEVQAYYKKLTEKFIRDWGFDGSKLDNMYTVPMCYNPAHHHKSPQDSVNAMADVYKTIFQTTRRIEAGERYAGLSLRYAAVVGLVALHRPGSDGRSGGRGQVRRRIKMYKALLGPESAVYGDHVELSAMTRLARTTGSSTAMTSLPPLALGGVVGTKFVWPDPGPKFKP